MDEIISRLVEADLDWATVGAAAAVGAIIAAAINVFGVWLGLRHQRRLAENRYEHERRMAAQDRLWEGRVELYKEAWAFLIELQKRLSAFQVAGIRVTRHTGEDRWNPFTKYLARHHKFDLWIDASLSGLEARLELFGTPEAVETLRQAVSRYQDAAANRFYFVREIIQLGWEAKPEANHYAHKADDSEGAAYELRDEFRTLMRRDVGNSS